MNSKKVRLFETLGMLGWLSARVPDTVFFGTKSMTVRWAERLLRGVRSEAREISYGDIEKAHALRAHAYRRAIERAAEIETDLAPLARAGNALGIDMELIIRKFLVETLFKRYEFLGLAKQYAAENPGTAVRVVASPLWGEELPVEVATRGSKFSARLGYFVGLLTIPLYGLLFALRNWRGDLPVIKDAVICEVDDPKIQSMFADLFVGPGGVRYVAEAQYLRNFGEPAARRIVPHRLGRQGLQRITKLSALFLAQGILSAGRLSRYGRLFFGLYGTLVRGVLLVTEAINSIYFAYEHLFTAKAVRNEFMRADGNLTVSLPYGTHVDSHFFAPAYQYNYDVLCSAGELQEQVYSLQQARTRIVLPAGPYESHKLGADDPGRGERVQRLMAL